MRKLLESSHYKHLKDPCVVFDGKLYHIYGSGAKTDAQEWTIPHFTATNINGPWKAERFFLEGVHGPAVCAPGVIFDNGEFHMFLQTDCFRLGGTVEHATSADGVTFRRENTALASQGREEAGIYDPHPSIAMIGGKKKYLLTYTGMPQVSRGDLYLAISDSIHGPWQRLGKILRHEEVWHHNEHADKNYEWGLEGGQIIHLPDGRFLLNAVCFLPGLPAGQRQRVFFAISDKVTGPYHSAGPMIEPTVSLDSWDTGENGHASAILEGQNLHLFYQARAQGQPWQYATQTFHVTDIRPVEKPLTQE